VCICTCVCERKRESEQIIAAQVSVTADIHDGLQLSRRASKIAFCRHASSPFLSADVCVCVCVRACVCERERERASEI